MSLHGSKAARARAAAFSCFRSSRTDWNCGRFARSRRAAAASAAGARDASGKAGCQPPPGAASGPNPCLRRYCACSSSTASTSPPRKLPCQSTIRRSTFHRLFLKAADAVSIPIGPMVRVDILDAWTSAGSVRPKSQSCLGFFPVSDATCSIAEYTAPPYATDPDTTCQPWLLAGFAAATRALAPAFSACSSSTVSVSAASPSASAGPPSPSAPCPSSSSPPPSSPPSSPPICADDATKVPSAFPSRSIEALPFADMEVPQRAVAMVIGNRMSVVVNWQQASPYERSSLFQQ